MTTSKRRVPAPACRGAARRRLHSDFGPPERRRHDRVVIERVAEESQIVRDRARVYSRSPLRTYLRRGLITPRQKEAGELLGRLWHLAGIEPRVVARYDELIVRGSVQGFVVRRGEAYERWRAAMRAVGPIAASEIVAACCEERSVGGGAAMEILRRGLDVLADHFGL